MNSSSRGKPSLQSSSASDTPSWVLLPKDGSGLRETIVEDVPGMDARSTGRGFEHRKPSLSYADELR